LFLVNLGGGGVLEPTFVGLGAAGHDVRTEEPLDCNKKIRVLDGLLARVKLSRLLLLPLLWVLAPPWR
jgi:hypothetical protein